MSETTRREIDFSLFVLYRLAERWDKTPAAMYRDLTHARVFDEYVIPYYDVLHTLGEEHLVEDVSLYAQKRGVTL